MKIDISKSNHKRQFILLGILMVFFIINFVTLTDYPFIHSDESWLSGFTRTVLEEGTFKSSEYFFTNYPRPIHGMRIIFTGLQALMIKVLGYNIGTFRLLSLILSTVSLYLIGIYFVKKKSFIWGILSILLIGSQVQFILMSHTARQEALILLIFITIWSLKDRHPILLGSIITIAIGVHPNSFLIATALIVLYVYEIAKKERRLKDLLQLLITLGLGASLFIAFSLYLNPSFFHDYLAFGEQLGVVNHPLNRFEGFYYYYYKLFTQIGGTYYLVDIRLTLILTPLVILSLLKGNKASLFILGINMAYLIIGRYNQTAIIFTLVFTWIGLIEILPKKKYAYILMGLLIIFSSIQSYQAIDKQWNEPYQALEEELAVIPNDKKVLANLNLEYLFDYNQLHDYRNLWQVTDFEAYIKKEKIEYIVLYEEMSYIHENPKWDILYGPLDYYESMVDYLKTCELVHEFTSQTYGIRIARYINEYPWYVKIYRVN